MALVTWKVIFRASVPAFAWSESVKSFYKTTLNTPSRDSKFDLPCCSGYEGFQEVQAQVDPLQKVSDWGPVNKRSSRGHPGVQTCPGLYVKCASQLSAQNRWPWHAALYVGGVYKCSAALIDSRWLLASSYCVQDSDVYREYVTAQLGVPLPELGVLTLWEQLIRVDEAKPVLQTEVVLLHLERAPSLNRHVWPLVLLQEYSAPQSSYECVALGQDSSNAVVSLRLKPMLSFVEPGEIYFQGLEQTEACTDSTNTFPWSGVVACRQKRGWYPAGVYYQPDGLCGFKYDTHAVSVVDILPHIRATMGELTTNLTLVTVLCPPDEGSSPVKAPFCDTVQCPLGPCLNSSALCDGVPHCRDSMDESLSVCTRRKRECLQEPNDPSCDRSKVPCGCIASASCVVVCRAGQLRCRNRRCVDKSNFCDGVDDCGDSSDEPSTCDCSDYLKMATPRLICDGKWNCLNKMDEKDCGCHDNTFQCPK
uniref:Peptidase S1A nudel domain-containing protein n=1 Tax=Timema cristinae TaxID=61476 RepID=A0A7R9H1L9_TIMCR|nr:unnamed protein product [Timema cristinae]